MHARELVELAAHVSANGASLLRGDGAVTQSLLLAYWSASKARFDSWSRDLKAWQQADLTIPPARRPAAFRSVAGVIAEILVTESLTRVWAALVAAYDQRRGLQDGEPIVHSALLGHVEARHRALTMLLHATGVQVDAAVRLNRLHRHTERWTDLLIGYLLAEADVSRFACQPERAKEFAADLRGHASWRAGQHAWNALLGSLREGFRHLADQPSPNADLNARIAASIVQCFPPNLADFPPPVEAHWPDRIVHLAEDAQEMLQQLWNDEQHDAAFRASSPQAAGWLRPLI